MSSRSQNAHLDPDISTEYVSTAWLVSARAACAPEAIAAIQDNEVLTYAQLNRRADKLAFKLASNRVGPETVVGLFVNRSLATLVGALGILKAGGAYLPLDPAWPNARLQSVLEDAKVTIVVTNQYSAERLSRTERQLVILDLKGELADPLSSSAGTTFRDEGRRPDDLAYVIYTSGSTGKPKGVEITDKNLSNLVAWHCEAFSITEKDRATLLSSPGFDASVWEMWPYLTAGASLHIPGNDIPKDPERLRDWLVEHAITVTFVPAVMAERLMQLRWPPTTALRILLTGADTLRRYPPDSLPFMVVNNYGPSECTVVTTSGAIPANHDTDMLPSIGRPITNAEVYIVDEQMRPLGAGCTGEVYIGGCGVGRGYRNRPDLTAAAFVSNPFGPPESRLYKTGDLASYLPDGQIAFLGRTDRQVKIRGYRIELAEIETAITRHSSVDCCVVVAREETPGEKRLLAYVVVKNNEELTEEELRDYLLLSLPEFMVPSNFYRLDELPLTTSGKIDSSALPPPDNAVPLGIHQYVPPQSQIETQLASMLAALLHMDRVGVNDNFFLVGGNSLLGAQVIARARDTFGIELSLLALFNHPTVRELASEIEQLIVAKLDTMNDEEMKRIADQGLQTSST